MEIPGGIRQAKWVSLIKFIVMHYVGLVTFDSLAQFYFYTSFISVLGNQPYTVAHIPSFLFLCCTAILDLGVPPAVKSLHIVDCNL